MCYRLQKVLCRHLTSTIYEDMRSKSPTTEVCKGLLTRHVYTRFKNVKSRNGPMQEAPKKSRNKMLMDCLIITMP